MNSAGEVFSCWQDYAVIRVVHTFTFADVLFRNQALSHVMLGIWGAAEVTVARIASYHCLARVWIPVSGGRWRNCWCGRRVGGFC
jgi:hypothetical protein